MMKTLTIRKLDLQDMQALVELSRDAGWNQQEAEIKDIISYNDKAQDIVPYLFIVTI